MKSNIETHVDDILVNGVSTEPLNKEELNKAFLDALEKAVQRCYKETSIVRPISFYETFHIPFTGFERKK